MTSPVMGRLAAYPSRAVEMGVTLTAGLPCGKISIRAAATTSHHGGSHGQRQPVAFTRLLTGSKGGRDGVGRCVTSGFYNLLPKEYSGFRVLIGRRRDFPRSVDK